MPDARRLRSMILAGANMPGTTRGQRRAIRRDAIRAPASAPRLKGPPRPIGCPPQLRPPATQKQFGEAGPTKAHYAGCRVYDKACGCPPGMWTMHSSWLGHPVCCPGECNACPDDWPPQGHYEVGLWPKHRPGSSETMPQAPDVANLCCPISRDPRGGMECPPGTVPGPDNRCYPPHLAKCFYTEYGEPAPPCPPGTYEYGQPEWSQDHVRLCCPLKEAVFVPS